MGKVDNTWTAEEEGKLLYLRRQGCTHREIAVILGRTRGSISGKLRVLADKEAADAVPEDRITATPAGPIRSVEDLAATLGIEAGEVGRYWVSTGKDGKIAKVSAEVRPAGAVVAEDAAEEVWARAREDFLSETDVAQPRRNLRPPLRCGTGDRQMLEVAIMDPHLGMLAWGKEVGEPYDLEIGIRDYRAAFRNLLGLLAMYPDVGEVLFLVGNDLFHVDGPAFDARGASKGGATTAGTMQDFDTRLARLFTHVRRLIVDCIDEALDQGVTVTVQMVPGNHDRHTTYKFGEVLHAWYRADDRVEVRNPPSKRDYYAFGANLFMFTHGEEFKRKRDNLVSVFATECPPELWVQGKVREVHVGHNHINMEKVYTGDPTETIWEGRGVRVRSLPGLTPEDSWHYEEGYKHGRRSTAIVWNARGGLAGLHEFTL